MDRELRDLVVVGGGPVGASLVRALHGLDICLAGARPADAARESGGFDARVYALSPGNVDFLRRIGAWERIPAERLAPVHAMRIFGDDARAVLHFDAYEAGAAELAWIVEDSALQIALWNGLEGAARQCERLELQQDQAIVSFADDSPVKARLVVGADGAQSFVRRAAGIEASERDFGQTALVANFRCEKPHQNIAYQWFQGGPVLALLPLPRQQVSMVWSLPSEEARRASAVSDAELEAWLERESRSMLGALSLASEVKSFPLRRVSARSLVAPRVALVGDAAHVIHPLAGQGLNLGLQDARVLAEVLLGREDGRDPGDYRLLRRYERTRAEPILAMDAMVSALFALYGAPGAAMTWLRNTGLNLTDRLPVLKNILMRQAML